MNVQEHVWAIGEKVLINESLGSMSDPRWCGLSTQGLNVSLGSMNEPKVCVAKNVVWNSHDV